MKIIPTAKSLELLEINQNDILEGTKVELEGPDYIPPPKNYKTLEMMLNEANFGKTTFSPPPVSVSGTREVLAILMELSDAVPDGTHSQAYFYDTFFNSTAPSVRDYFDEVSYGVFTYIPGSVLGWYSSDRC